FKPSVRAYVDPIKQRDRVSQVNWEFIKDFEKFKKEKREAKPELTDRELTIMAVDNKSKDNLFKPIAEKFRESAKAVLLDDQFSKEENEYVSKEYNDIADKLWSEENGYGILYENVLQDLKRFGIRVKMLKEDVEVGEEQDTKEMWMEVSSSPFEAFTPQLKQGLGLLMEGVFTGKKEVDENEVATGFKEVEPIYDDVGNPRSVDVDNAYNTLMEEASNSLSVEDMMSKIRVMADNYPWAKQLYEILNGNKGSSIIKDVDHFKSQLYYIGLQNPSPTPKYLLEKWDGKNKMWILSNSTTKGLVDRLKKEWSSNIDNPSYNQALNKPDKIKDIQNRLKVKKEDAVLLHNILNGVGINIPLEAVEKIVLNKGNLQQLTENLINNIERKNTIQEGAVSTAIEGIATLAKKYYKEYHQSSYSSVEGETVQTYIRNSFMARQINKFRRGQTAFYRQDPFYEANTNTIKVNDIEQHDYSKDLWLDRFDIDAKNKLEMALVDGTSYVNGQSTTFQDMSPIEFLSYTLNAYFNNGNGVPKSGNKYIGKAFYSAQLMADSSSHALIGFESYTNDVILTKLVEVALREYNSILEQKKNPINVKNYNPRFILLPNLEEKDFENFNVERVKGKIKSYVDRIVKEQLAKYNKIGFIVEGKSEHLDSRITNIEEFITNFVYNDYYAQTQVVSLFHGKLFMYKSMEDFYKRAKEIWSPGNFINANQEGVNKEFFTLSVESQMFDYSNNKDVIDAIMSNMRKVGIDEITVLTTGAKYGYTDGTLVGNKKGVTLSDGSKIVSGQTDATDAQGIIDIHRWREIMLGKGMEPVEVERIYKAI
ncbi:MAG TPA: hypothetical protein PLG47_04885, partial [Candidatus Dojkabacteria bacterium]|nr:hypothetical protein [Candidatus Dojkabacteria bacterium]